MFCWLLWRTWDEDFLNIYSFLQLGAIIAVPPLRWHVFRWRTVELTLIECAFFFCLFFSFPRPPPHFCRLPGGFLLLFRPPEEGEPSTTFAVSVRDSGAADFLVPENRYMESVSVDWKPGLRVMMEWKEEEDGGGGGGLVPFYGKDLFFSCNRFFTFHDTSSRKMWSL